MGLLDPKVDPPLEVLERDQALINGLDAKDLWMGDVQVIILRINGKCYTEPFNRMMHVDLNLALYLSKHFSLTLQRAMSKVRSNRYALLNRSRNALIDSE